MAGSMLPETSCKARAAPDQEDNVLLSGPVRAVECLRDARDSERVGFRRHVADRREDDIRVLPREPVHFPTEGHTDGVRRDELNNRRAMLVGRAALAPVVPDEARGAQDAVECPDDQGGPEVVPEAATSTRDKVSDTMLADQLTPAVAVESCERGVGEDVPEFARVEVSADDEYATHVRDGVRSEWRRLYTRGLPNQEDMGEKEELEEGVADEADRQDGCQRECDQPGSAPSHPSMTEVGPLGKAVEWSYSVLRGLGSRNGGNIPGDGATQGMNP